MSIALRIRKIREVRKLKQTNVAQLMNITQQAYSCLEQEANNCRLETLAKFCRVMNVQLSYLVALDVPITDETMEHFGSTSYNEFIIGYKKLEQKLEIFDELMKSKTETLLKHQIGEITPLKRSA